MMSSDSRSDRGRPLAPDDCFHIGSLTKLMAAVGLLKLVEAGKVSTLDDLLKWNRALHEGRVLASATYLPSPGLTVALLRNRNDGREYEALAKLARQLAAMALGQTLARSAKSGR